MEAARPSLDLQTCHDQGHSPLFQVLPPEIRNKIFANSLVQYEDDAAAYPEDSYWYRPGFKGPKISSSSLLRTCKLAYKEGQRVFMEEVEWAFWFDRGPEERSGSRNCFNFFNSLDPAQVRNLEQVRFFMQMYRLEGGDDLNRIFDCDNFRPSRLTITIRYSDWWYWESNEPLKMDQRWLRVFNGSPGLRELRVEYETLKWKKPGMDAIVARNKRWALNVRDGGYLSAESTKLEEWSWTGPSKLEGKTWDHHGEGDVIEYVVVTDTWKYREGPMPEDVLQRQAGFEDEPSDMDVSDDEEDDDEMEYDDEDDEVEEEADEEASYGE